ncbi:MAG: hypothetical protein M1820_005683 [Bogoriella megaspora]|nr:MAG: hypothetical protein M1820_005683 [Bogoriella megaspora]
MELRMQPAVLPSQGPLPPEHALSDEVPHHVLREATGNERHWDAERDLDFGEAAKGASYPSCENYHAPSRPYSQGSVGKSSSHTSSWRSRDPRAKEKEARALFRELSKCDEYQKYRKRQIQGQRSQKGDQVWPDNLEEAFFWALVFIPPMGRSKEQVRPNDSPKGRNELIAEYIERLTEVPRDRKQVSSHIQVLKPWVKSNPRIMQYFSGKGSTSKSRHQHQSLSSHTSAVPRTLGDARRLSDLSEVDYAQHRFGDIRSTKPIEPSGFEMSVLVKSKDTSKDRDVHHMISNFGSAVRKPDLQLCDLTRIDFLPRKLTSILSKTPSDCRIFSFEAPLDIFTKPLPKGAELGIELAYAGALDHSPDTHFEARTRFFDDTTALKFYHEGEIVEAAHDPITYNRNTQVLGLVHFGSRFWATKIHEYSQVLRCQPGHRLPTPQDEFGEESRDELNFQDQVKKAKARVDAALERLCAVQEIYAYPAGQDRADSQLVLMSVWRFTRNRSGNQPHATWQRLILPNLEVKIPYNFEYATGLLSPSHPCNTSWQYESEAVADADDLFDPMCELSFGQQQYPAQPPVRTLGSPVELDSQALLLGLPDYAQIQNPLTGVSRFPYPGLAGSNPVDFNYDYVTGEGVSISATSCQDIDPAITTGCCSSAEEPPTNAIDFEAGHIQLSFDFDEGAGVGFDSGVIQPPRSSSLQGLALQEPENSLPGFEQHQQRHESLDSSTALPIAPMQAIADTDIAAPCPLQITSTQMQDYARRWGDFQQSAAVFGSSGNIDGGGGGGGAAEDTYECLGGPSCTSGDTGGHTTVGADVVLRCEDRGLEMTRESPRRN